MLFLVRILEDGKRDYDLRILLKRDEVLRLKDNTKGTPFIVFSAEDREHLDVYDSLQLLVTPKLITKGTERFQEYQEKEREEIKREEEYQEYISKTIEELKVCWNNPNGHYFIGGTSNGYCKYCLVKYSYEYRYVIDSNLARSEIRFGSKELTLDQMKQEYYDMRGRINRSTFFSCTSKNSHPILLTLSEVKQSLQRFLRAESSGRKSKGNRVYYTGYSRGQQNGEELIDKNLLVTPALIVKGEDRRRTFNELDHKMKKYKREMDDEQERQDQKRYEELEENEVKMFNNEDYFFPEDDTETLPRYDARIGHTHSDYVYTQEKTFNCFMYLHSKFKHNKKVEDWFLEEKCVKAGKGGKVALIYDKITQQHPQAKLCIDITQELTNYTDGSFKGLFWVFVVDSDNNIIDRQKFLFDFDGEKTTFKFEKEEAKKKEAETPKEPPKSLPNPRFRLSADEKQKIYDSFTETQQKTFDTLSNQVKLKIYKVVTWLGEMKKPPEFDFKLTKRVQSLPIYNADLYRSAMTDELEISFTLNGVWMSWYHLCCFFNKYHRQYHTHENPRAVKKQRDRVKETNPEMDFEF
jgi:hypothetical protein